MQETKEPVKIPGFRCYNSNRGNSRFGGVCIGVKNDLSKGIVPVCTKSCQDIAAVRLKKHFFAIRDDIVLINVYDSPLNSSYKQRSIDEQATLDYVTNVIENLTNTAEVIAVGDFNARIGLLSDQEESHFDPATDLPEDYSVELPVRSSKDLKVNANGKPFLSFIKSSDLSILNGRTLGDIFGEATCIKYNGFSLVDYVCVSRGLFDNVNSLFVGDLNYLSDHCPVTLSLGLGCHRNIILTGKNNPHFNDAPMAFKWKDDDARGTAASRFSKAQDAELLQQTISLLANKDLKSVDEVLDANNELIRLYNDLSSKSLSLKSSIRNKKKKWFDSSCRLAKRNLNKAAKKSGKSPSDESARFYYHRLKKDYKRLIKSKKAQYLYDINRMIEGGTTINWKTFKNLKDIHSDGDCYDLFDLQNFYTFFKDLYLKKCSKTNHNGSGGPIDITIVPSSVDLNTLNDPFTDDQINSAMRKLKTNKSVSIDQISNEMLKHSNVICVVLSRTFLTDVSRLASTLGACL